MTALGPPHPDIRFFQCPDCERQFAKKPGRPLTYRWLHPISLALYGVILSEDPLARAGRDAVWFVNEKPIDLLRTIIAEIREELDDPTQPVREILDCRASEETIREYLGLLADGIERLLADGKSAPADES